MCALYCAHYIVQFFLYIFFFFKVVELVGGGSVIHVAYPAKSLIDINETIRLIHIVQDGRRVQFQDVIDGAIIIFIRQIKTLHAN